MEPTPTTAHVRLETVRNKMATIRRDLASAPGLSPLEADLAIRVGLIETSERWWWLESWISGEREVEKEMRGGQIRQFEDVESFFEDFGSFAQG